MNTLPEFSIIWYPSTRGIAYLNVLRDIGARPQSVITLENNRNKADKFTFQRAIKAQNPEFDINYQLENYLTDFPSPVFHSLATSINDPTVSQLLHSQGAVTWLFTGGGILRAHLFQCGARYLHVHPGDLPNFRGSTCFYFSLLKSNTLNASAFFLKPELDSGDVICKRTFQLNFPATNDAALFMDHIVDPWIRALTLKTAFENGLNNTSPVENIEAGPRPYYVMHPVLRSLTVLKQLQVGNPCEPSGIRADV